MEAKPQANAGLKSRIPAGDDSPVRVRVTNARDSDREKFQLSWQLAEAHRSASGPMEIYLPPGQTRSFPAPMLPAGTTTAELHLSGDDVDFDNRSYFAAPEAAAFDHCLVRSGCRQQPANHALLFAAGFPGNTGPGR